MTVFAFDIESEVQVLPTEGVVEAPRQFRVCVAEDYPVVGRNFSVGHSVRTAYVHIFEVSDSLACIDVRVVVELLLGEEAAVNFVSVERAQRLAYAHDVRIVIETASGSEFGLARAKGQYFILVV